jgi:hypothetical protein
MVRSQWHWPCRASFHRVRAHQLSRHAFGVLLRVSDAGKRFQVKNAAKALPFGLISVLLSMTRSLMHTLKPAVGAFKINQIDALYLACLKFASR